MAGGHGRRTAPARRGYGPASSAAAIEATTPILLARRCLIAKPLRKGLNCRLFIRSPLLAHASRSVGLLGRVPRALTPAGWQVSAVEGRSAARLLPHSRAAQQRAELPPFHSITSSARASRVGGTSSCRPLVRTVPPEGEARPMYFALKHVCRRALAAGRLGNEQAGLFFERNFRPLRIAKLGDSAGFLTGYYEP